MNEDIFIAIPAFNEKFTHITVQDAFAKADNPENVYIGIFNQKSNNLEFEDATLLVLESETHMKLTDPETGLYTDSSASIFDMLESEMKHGRIVQIEQ